MQRLPERFLERMKSQLGAEFEAFCMSLELPPVRGLRVNTLKISKERFLELSPWQLEASSTLDEGFVICGPAEHIGSHPYHIAGLFYMQEPSAMSVIGTAEVEPGMRVLDLCAAPGGKSGGIAARLGGKGLLVSNEIVPSRAKLTARNLERLGIANAVVTCARPDALCANFIDFFDRVIVDAPCSGEGMFRKDPTAVCEWSEEHVLSCAKRQSAILESAAEAVRVGGKLIYSTCTFSREENEEVIERFLAGHSEFSLEAQHRLYPHTIKGEGHFSARLIKHRASTSGVLPNHAYENRSPVSSRRGSIPKAAAVKPMFSRLNSIQQSTAGAFFDSTCLGFDRDELLSRLVLDGARLIYLPFELPEAFKCRQAFSLVSCGVQVGEFINDKVLRPAHGFFMAAHGLGYQNSLDLPLTSLELKRFLAGEQLESTGAASGVFLPVTVDGFPVGFGKAVDGVIKNHLPKGLIVPIR